MPPRHQTLPPAQTSSAREALQSFYCTLCSKGYSRMNEYEAHLSSYDHTHKQRLKDMKAMVKDPGAGARARKAEAKADGIVSIKIPDAEGGGGGGGPVSSGFKKGGFKKSGFKSAFGMAVPEREVEPGAGSQARPSGEEPSAGRGTPQARASQEYDSEDDDYERYNPRCPTD